MNANHMAVMQLKLLGYPLINIRRALPKLTGLDHPTVAQKLGVSRPYVTITMNSGKGNYKIQNAIAEVYGIPIEVLFNVHDRSKGSPDR